ncbi:MAG: hypothetical protein JXA72_01030 [Bacteroidales bacterium]|nr:hypothetical protein [Bacteroidales bacterium]
MNFIENYQQLKGIFNLSQDEIKIPQSKVKLINQEFHSSAGVPDNFEGQPEDVQIKENVHFRYPVILPEGKNKAGQVIILLHGLNERTWHKHLAGARMLSERTGKAVLMFPLSYHINRGLPEWTDNRKMAGLLEVRKKSFSDVQEASVVNLALSERLTEYPQRFYFSGLQSIKDLISLMRQIKAGDHPLFETGTSTDIFAYSISCMLVQALMISNPEGILDKSKIVFFAGGSIFSRMKGVSRFIMDSVAFKTILRFYTDAVTRKAGFLNNLQSSGMEKSFGNAFRSLIIPGLYEREREQAMAGFSKNLLVIAMQNDRIMPVEGIREATGERFFKSGQFRLVHFPYDYTHENPFPVLYHKINQQVEKAFMSVYEPALEFYNR